MNGTSLDSIDVIQLKRNGTNIISIISDGSVSWQDKQLQNRSNVTASTENINQWYLHLKIKACDVNDTVDKGMYHCELFAHYRKNPIENSSEKKNLTITGSTEEKEKYCGSNEQESKEKGKF